ncbi:unnamed protein product [Effrenium voratum]|nr:unnamed protein product [Effrenium voratum]
MALQWNGETSGSEEEDKAGSMQGFALLEALVPGVKGMRFARGLIYNMLPGVRSIKARSCEKRHELVKLRQSSKDDHFDGVLMYLCRRLGVHMGDEADRLAQRRGARLALQLLQLARAFGLRYPQGMPDEEASLPEGLRTKRSWIMSVCIAVLNIIAGQEVKCSSAKDDKAAKWKLAAQGIRKCVEDALLRALRCLPFGLSAHRKELPLMVDSLLEFYPQLLAAGAPGEGSDLEPDQAGSVRAPCKRKKACEADDEPAAPALRKAKSVRQKAAGAGKSAAQRGAGETDQGMDPWEGEGTGKGPGKRVSILLVSEVFGVSCSWDRQGPVPVPLPLPVPVPPAPAVPEPAPRPEALRQELQAAWAAGAAAARAAIETPKPEEKVEPLTAGPARSKLSEGSSAAPLVLTPTYFHFRTDQ